MFLVFLGRFAESGKRGIMRPPAFFHAKELIKTAFQCSEQRRISQFFDSPGDSQWEGLSQKHNLAQLCWSIPP
jgi:hypothetical protein